MNTNAEDTDSDNSNLRSDPELLEIINELSNENKEIHANFTEKNKDIIYDKINDKLKMNLKYEKEFKDHLQKKLNKLDIRLNILQMKYNTYNVWYDRFNILIIIISSLLSIIEAFRNEISHLFENDRNETLKIIFNMIPLSISGSITCLAAIIKFKKYQEKMENMQFTREKVITATSKIKTVQESLWFSNEVEFNDIKKRYLEDIYNVYNESNSELERHIKLNDYHKFKKIYNPPKTIVKKEDDIRLML